MNESPSPTLVADVQALISALFEVSTAEAHTRAVGLVLLAENWGTPESAKNLDWSLRVKRDLGSKLQWRSTAIKEQFEKDEKDRLASLEKHVPRRVIKPFGHQGT
jgi:hypothetical protein